MDIFLTKTHGFASEGLFLTLWSHMYYFYDGWMHFFGLQNQDHHSLPLLSWKEQ